MKTLNHLSQIPDLIVTSRTSTLSYADNKPPIGQIASELNVDFIMEGSVRRVGDRVRITVQLIEAANDAHMWSNNFDRELDDIFAVQDEVASQVAEALKVKFKGDAANQPTRNIAAYELFLEARELGSRVNRDDMALSIRKFREAIVIRPGVRRCLAWYGLQPSSGRLLEFRFAGPDRGCPRCR